MPDPTCKDCRHWHQTENRSMIVRTDRQGQCRERLHLLPIPTSQGMGGKAVFLAVPENHPACGQFVQRVAIERGG